MPINCTVETCHYWGSGNKCQASQILVTSDSFAQSHGDEIDALNASTITSTPTDSCMQTCCKTFVHRDSPQTTKHTDNVTKHHGGCHR